VFSGKVETENVMFQKAGRSTGNLSSCRNRDGSVELLPSHLERKSASSFFSPAMWLQSSVMPERELHMHSLRTKRFKGF